MARSTGGINFPNNFEVKKAAPLDARLWCSTLNDMYALRFTHKGMIVSVTDETDDALNGLYVMQNQIAPDVDSQLSDWEIIGANDNSSGIIPSGQFKWSNWMGQAPGFQAGNMEYGGVSAYGEATQLTFHKEDADGVDQSTFLDQYLNAKSGQIKTILDTNSSHDNVYQIVGASIDSNGNYVFDVYNVSYNDIAVTTGSTTVYFVFGPTATTIDTVKVFDFNLDDGGIGYSVNADNDYEGGDVYNSNPTLYVQKGQKYKIKNSSGGHPIVISKNNDYTTNDPTGIEGGTLPINNGEHLYWTIPMDAPDSYYYYCNNPGHSDSMNGEIKVGASTSNNESNSSSNLQGVLDSSNGEIIASVIEDLSISSKEMKLTGNSNNGVNSNNASIEISKDGVGDITISGSNMGTPSRGDVLVSKDSDGSLEWRKLNRNYFQTLIETDDSYVYDLDLGLNAFIYHDNVSPIYIDIINLENGSSGNIIIDRSDLNASINLGSIDGRLITSSSVNHKFLGGIEFTQALETCIISYICRIDINNIITMYWTIGNSYT